MDTNQALLKQVWDDLMPFVEALRNTIPPNAEVDVIRFKGHNPLNLNSPVVGEIQLWVNPNSHDSWSFDSHDQLLRDYGDTLRQAWNRLVEEFGTQLDQVMIGPDWGDVVVPGLYLRSAKIVDSLPSFQL